MGKNREGEMTHYPYKQVDGYLPEESDKDYGKCPKCGSDKVNGAINDMEDRYRECQSCGYTWTEN